MILIVKNGRQKVVENSTGLIETDTVLAEIGLRFAFVPFKVNAHLTCLMK
jgi:hypothetical protein